MRLTVLLFILVCASTAHAALDDVLVVSDAEVARTTIAQHALIVRTRGAVREYAGTDGRVFAVKWSGRSSQGIVNVLGTHYAEYEAALATRHNVGHNVVFVRTPSLEVSMVMHFRTPSGYAVLSSKLPQGVRIDALP